MPSEAAVNAAAAGAETAAKGAAKGAFWIFGKTWSGLVCACGIFSRQVKKLSVPTVTALLRVLNLANATLLGLACFYAFQMISGSVTRTFLATYIGLFALLLVLFETRVKYTEGAIRRLFGFMFSYSGRTIFLIFLGAICFGMLSESYKDTNAYTACWGVGLATLCNALFNCFIVCSHPGFQNANKSGGAEGGAEGTPGDPAKLSDAQIRAYLEAHPELAAQAMGGGSIQARAVQPSEGVPEWGATATVSPAAVATAPSGVGFGGFFGGKKGGKKDAAGGGEAAGYVPPAVPAAAAAAPAAAAFTGSLAASDAYANDPFKPPSGGSAGGASPHEHHTVKVSTYAPPAVPAAAPPAVASTPEDDNPFASSDNPFESS